MSDVVDTHKHIHTLSHTHTIHTHSEEREWRRQSQSVQRHLPRPVDVNTTILRGAPHKDQKYRALYEAEELIKQEMIVMMQHDLVHLPPAPTPQGGLQVTKATLSKTRQELEKNPKEDFTEEEIQEVRESVHLKEVFFYCLFVLICMHHPYSVKIVSM